MDIGLLIARSIIGLLMAGHGAQKAFGWFGGYGLDGTGKFMESLGFRPGRLFAGAAAWGEIVSGLLVAAGLFGAAGPALMLAVMIVAAGTVHWKHGVFVTSNGIEVPLIYATVAIALALTGPGRFSLDALAGLHVLSSPPLAWGALIAGAIGGAANLKLRHAPAAA
jgi:putative oxidoreductase